MLVARTTPRCSWPFGRGMRGSARTFGKGSGGRPGRWRIEPSAKRHYLGDGHEAAGRPKRAKTLYNNSPEVRPKLYN